MINVTMVEQVYEYRQVDGKSLSTSKVITAGASRFKCGFDTIGDMMQQCYPDNHHTYCPHSKRYTIQHKHQITHISLTSDFGSHLILDGKQYSSDEFVLVVDNTK